MSKVEGFPYSGELPYVLSGIRVPDPNIPLVAEEVFSGCYIIHNCYEKDYGYFHPLTHLYGKKNVGNTSINDNKTGDEETGRETEHPDVSDA